MNKRIIIWTILIVLLLITLPGIMERWAVERENNTYEIAVAYEEIADLATRGNITLDEVIQLLKEAGLTAISLEPSTLQQLEEQGIITIFRNTDLENILRFTEGFSSYILVEGTYLTRPTDELYIEKLVEILNPEKIKIAGESLYFIPYGKKFLETRSIGYDHTSIKQIKNHQLQIILRVDNDTQTDIIPDRTDFNQRLLFTGEEVYGYPDGNQINQFASELYAEGYHFYTIEFANQLGSKNVAESTNYDVIRLHSIHLDNKSLSENINQAVRAVKERNIRSIFFRLQTKDNARGILENAIQFVAGVKNKMPASFELASPYPFQTIDLPIWRTLFVFVAGILFTYLTSRILEKKWIRLFASIFMLALTIAYFLTENLLVLQLFGLIIAIITPIFSILATSQKGNTNFTWQFIKAILINFLGIFIVVGLFNGNAFITGEEIFRGVKLIYVAPLLFVTLFIFYQDGWPTFKTKWKDIFQNEVKYWHLIILGFVGLIAYYYLSRTGNAGVVSELELTLRNFLEDTLYVRPRTKEFLIGFPFYILAIYLIKKQVKFSKLLLIPATIGFLSMMNTFLHFHIPLHLSLLRSFYGIVLGYIIGVLFIYIYKVLSPTVHRLFKGRAS
ncbi:DUF5693 family protein [Oceanobacillus sp. CAU 1775]